MEEDNRKLKERMASVEAKAVSALTAKNKLKSDLEAATSATSRDSDVSVESSTSSKELASLKAKIEELHAQISDVPALTKELVQTKVSVIVLIDL